MLLAMTSMESVRTCTPRSNRPVEYEPSPEQIAEACRAIQAIWSDDERLRRGRGVIATDPVRHSTEGGEV